MFTTMAEGAALSAICTIVFAGIGSHDSRIEPTASMVLLLQRRFDSPESLHAVLMILRVSRVDERQLSDFGDGFLTGREGPTNPWGRD